MNRWTVLTVVMLVLCAAEIIGTIWDPSLGNVAGLALVLVVTWWVVVGCARRGEPLARRLTHH